MGGSRRERESARVGGWGFHRGSTVDFFFFKFSKSIEVKFQKAQKAHTSRPTPRRKKGRTSLGFLNGLRLPPTEAQPTAPRAFLRLGALF